MSEEQQKDEASGAEEQVAVPDSVAIVAPSGASLARGPLSAVDMATRTIVDSDETYELAAEELAGFKKRGEALEEERKKITRPLDDAKAAVMNLFRSPVAMYAQASTILTGKMLAFRREQKAKAEAERLAAEQVASAERARLKAEADALAAEGKAGEAQVKQAIAAMVVAAPAVSHAPKKVAGLSVRSSVDFEVTDVLELVKHVAAHPELIGLVQANETKLRQYVTSLGMATKLEGVRVFEKDTLASRK